jgi:hypothetical protein
MNACAAGVSGRPAAWRDEKRASVVFEEDAEGGDKIVFVS